MGAALESSSHRFGQVSDSCLEYEVILGNGEKRILTESQERELFWALSGSYGTLAFLTLVKMRLISATKSVRLSFKHYSAETIIPALSAETNCAFKEALLFSPDKAVEIQGEWSDCKRFSYYPARPYAAWFYQQVAAQKSGAELHLPTLDYLFRYDRGAFWMGRYLLSYKEALRYFFTRDLTQIELRLKKIGEKNSFPSFLFRLLLGWALSSQRLYSIWHHLPKALAENLFFIQDFYLPLECAAQALSFFAATTQLSPIWLCPIKGAETPQFLSPHFGHAHLINFGLYGIPKKGLPIPQLTAEQESALTAFKGRKMLYAFSYYQRELFDLLYDAPRYLELRKKFCADLAFLPLYNKISSVL
jgi:Delta24-sterol reductase